MRCFFSSLCALAIAGSLAAAAEPGWPGWLGPNRDGKSLDTGLLKQWPKDGPKLLWKIDGLGSGYSSPAVTGGKIYISGDKDGTLTIFALDMDGKQLWTKEFGRSRGGPDGARSSPVIDGGNLYLLNGNGPIGCFDAATGDQKWSREAKEFGGKPGGWGYAESVLIYKNTAVFKPGGKNCIVALDKTNGQTIWMSSGFDAGPEYGSCLLVSFEDQPIILTGSNRGLVAVDATNGKMLWSNDFSAHNTANCPTPAYQDGYVFWANGYGKGGICMKLKMEDGKVAADVAWKTRDMDCQHGGYIIDKGFIYGNNGGGWACLDLKTGKKQWSEQAVGKGSLCFADGMLYLFSEHKGTAGLAACSTEGLQLEGEFNVEGTGPSWAHPVVAGGRLYLRYDENLYCFDVKAGGSPTGSSRAAAPTDHKTVVYAKKATADEAEPAAGHPRSGSASAPITSVTGPSVIKDAKVEFVAPVLGTKSPITGKVTGLAPMTNYQIAVLVSNDRKIWWDKTHNVHGVPIKEDGTFKISGWVVDPHDLTVKNIGIWVVPSTFGAVHAEGAPLPKKLVEAAVTALVKSREGGPGATKTATIPADYKGKPAKAAIELPGTIKVTEFDSADGPNISYGYDGDKPRIGKFDKSHKTIKGEPEDVSQSYLGWTKRDEWVKVTVHVKEAGTYVIGGHFAAAGKNGRLSFS
ncbi:MAG TPA: PQQ-binding-like beta-propeller repeat protein, partial [Pirellulales bacterium]|nr:PQQ-binding-like beta-propeller repeat protein [Pirellulales bacterium]